MTNEQRIEFNRRMSEIRNATEEKVRAQEVVRQMEDQLYRLENDFKAWVEDMTKEVK